MQLTLKIRSISYEDAALALLPMVKDSGKLPTGGLGKLAAALLELPEETIRAVVGGIPGQTWNEVLSELATEHREKLLEAANGLLRPRGVALKDLGLTPSLELTALADRLDYDALLAALLPQPGNLLGRMVRGGAGWVSQEWKNAQVMRLLQHNEALILTKLTELAAGQGIRAELESLTVRLDDPKP